MAQRSLRDLRTDKESVEEGISYFACRAASVDLCARLLMEKERMLKKDHALKKTEKQMVEALKELDKYRGYFQSLLSCMHA